MNTETFQRRSVTNTDRFTVLLLFILFTLQCTGSQERAGKIPEKEYSRVDSHAMSYAVKATGSSRQTFPEVFRDYDKYTTGR